MARGPTRIGAQVKHRSAPVEGWDTESELSDMDPKRAVLMDNMFAEPESVDVRRGYSAWATDLPSLVETLAGYAPPDGGYELWAWSAGGIYDVSSQGAVGAPALSGLNSSQFQTVQQGGLSNHFLHAVNGQDAALIYDGTSWATNSLTGPDPTKLIWCNVHQRRFWAGEDASIDAWYLPIDAVSGAMVKFPLGSVFRKGGYIMAMGTWTRDSGAGADDVAAFITSEGEVAIYSGTDPASADTWALVGVYTLGEPIGRRCIINSGTELLVITEQGIFPLISAIGVDESRRETIELTRQIATAMNRAVREARNMFGWQPFIYPFGTMAIVNVPKSNGTFEQFVFNTITGAPSRFKNIPARCWALKGNEPYFGSSQKVFRYDFGQSDDGAAIEYEAIQAFDYFDYEGREKIFQGMEIVASSNGDPQISADLLIDFDTSSTIPTSVPATVTAARWGIDRWGIGKWGGAATIFKGWRGARGKGDAAAIHVKGATQSVQPKWISSKVRFTPGAIM